MPATSPPKPHVLWKGAISFGLVHIPVALYSATTDHGIDFDWLDKRTMDPVGYKRINKKTGKEIAREQIVKGVEYEDGRYVVITDEEISAAYPKTTQTIEIETFVPSNGIPFVYLERPYYVAPINKGAKVYALLRETLRQTGRVGVARVVIQTKQHLAVLVPTGPGLVLNLLRWGADVRPWKDLQLPAEGAKAAGLTERELKMANQLVKDMSSDWNPDEFKDSFKDDILKLIDRKVAAGDTEAVEPIEAVDASDKGEKGGSARILDLTELLQRSLRKGSAATTEDDAAPRKNAKAGRAAKSDKPSGASASSRNVSKTVSPPKTAPTASAAKTTKAVKASEAPARKGAATKTPARRRAA